MWQYVGWVERSNVKPNYVKNYVGRFSKIDTLYGVAYQRTMVNTKNK